MSRTEIVRNQAVLRYETAYGKQIVVRFRVKSEVRYFLNRVNDQIARWRPILKPEELAEYKRAAEIYSRLLPTAR